MVPIFTIYFIQDFVVEHNLCKKRLRYNTFRIGSMLASGHSREVLRSRPTFRTPYPSHYDFDRFARVPVSL